MPKGSLTMPSRTSGGRLGFDEAARTLRLQHRRCGSCDFSGQLDFTSDSDLPKLPTRTGSSKPPTCIESK